jgi:sulfur-carrier protein adenylyltransferase/sulfurtransferase
MRCNTLLTVHDLKRYDRQIRLPEVGKEGQQKIKASSVVVVGAGALGCPVLQYLAAAGVGTIGIVDNDWVDESNLHRQTLFGVNDIEKPKPVAARERLILNNPEINYNIHYVRLNPESSLNILRQYDIIVDCTDNFASRYLISDSAVILNKPVVYGAIYRLSGQVMVLNYNNGPTLRCLYPEPPHPLEVQTCEETGIMGPVAGIIGSMQANEVLKIILGSVGILSGRMFVFDASVNSVHTVTFERDSEKALITELKSDYNDMCLSLNESANEIGMEQLEKMMKADPHLSLVDLREEDHLTDIGFNAIHIPYHQVSLNIDRILKMERVVFFCNNGIQSINVFSYFQKYHNKNNMFVLNL